jgi:hypothetical protein
VELLFGPHFKGGGIMILTKKKYSPYI